MRYQGDFSVDETVDVWLTLNDKSGGRVASSSDFEVGDFFIYKDGNIATYGTITYS